MTTSAFTPDQQREATRELSNAGAPFTTAFHLGLVKGVSSGSSLETLHSEDLEASHSEQTTFLSFPPGSLPQQFRQFQFTWHGASLLSLSLFRLF